MRGKNINADPSFLNSGKNIRNVGAVIVWNFLNGKFFHAGTFECGLIYVCDNSGSLSFIVEGLLLPRLILRSHTTEQGTPLMLKV
jgi:hypothetical protein